MTSGYERYERLRIAGSLADGAAGAIRWTEQALNNWLRQAGPAFDASLALEFFQFAGPDIREGVRALREKRAPEHGPRSITPQEGTHDAGN